MSCKCKTGSCTHCPDKHPPGCLLGADPGWLSVHFDLRALHIEKGAVYGRDDERLANYVETSQAVGEPDEFACWMRIHEKCVRALNLLRAGRGDENEEGVDVAALAIAAESLRRRRAA